MRKVAIVFVLFFNVLFMAAGCVYYPKKRKEMNPPPLNRATPNHEKEKQQNEFINNTRSRKTQKNK